MVRLQSRSDGAKERIGKLEQLLLHNGRKLTEVELIVSPYTKRIMPDDLKRYRDIGISEVAMLANSMASRRPRPRASRRWQRRGRARLEAAQGDDIAQQAALPVDRVVWHRRPAIRSRVTRMSRETGFIECFGGYRLAWTMMSWAETRQFLQIR